jgi:hypothetical protein
MPVLCVWINLFRKIKILKKYSKLHKTANQEVDSDLVNVLLNRQDAKTPVLYCVLASWR